MFKEWSTWVQLNNDSEKAKTTDKWNEPNLIYLTDWLDFLSALCSTLREFVVEWMIKLIRPWKSAERKTSTAVIFSIIWSHQCVSGPRSGFAIRGDVVREEQRDYTRASWSSHVAQRARDLGLIVQLWNAAWVHRRTSWWGTEWPPTDWTEAKHTQTRQHLLMLLWSAGFNSTRRDEPDDVIHCL